MSDLNIKTYPVVTLEEVQEARQKRDNSIDDFRNKYYGYLMTCLCEAGFVDSHKVHKVRAKSCGTIGILRIESEQYSNLYPYGIKFYPIKKDGKVSLKSKYITQFYGWRIENLLEDLLEAFELVGDDNAS